LSTRDKGNKKENEHKKKSQIDKIKTSVYLKPTIYDEIKNICEKKGISYSRFAIEALERAKDDPNFLDPTQQLETETAWKQFQEDLKNLQQLREDHLEERFNQLEVKINAIMEQLNIPQPSKDTSGRRIFDD
jgi:hypothetical protein